MFPKRLLTGLGVCLALIGCSGNPASELGASTSTPNTPLVQGEPSATSQVDPVTASPVPPTQTSMNTAVPSAAPPPTIPPVPTSAVPLTPEGPWLLFLASKLQTQGWWRQVWAVNADGTGLNELIDEHVLTFDAQPVVSIEQGFKLAYVTRTDWDVNDPTLKIISLPGGEIEIIALLTGPTGGEPPVPADYVSTAVREGGLAWSPDGRWLAFVGALDGKSVDVYTYDTFSGDIIRLTDGPAHACRLSWSPDGDYVLHQGFDMVGMGGPAISGLWAARADGMGAVSLVDDSLAFYYVSEETWLSSTELIFASQVNDGESNIRVVDIESGDGLTIHKEIFSDAAYAPQHNVWLFARAEWFRKEMGEGAPLTLYKSGERIDISDDYLIEYVSWIPTSGVFLGTTTFGEVYTISLEGEVSKLPVEPDWQLHYAPPYLCLAG